MRIKQGVTLMLLCALCLSIVGCSQEEPSEVVSEVTVMPIESSVVSVEESSEESIEESSEESIDENSISSDLLILDTKSECATKFSEYATGNKTINITMTAPNYTINQTIVRHNEEWVLDITSKYNVDRGIVEWVPSMYFDTATESIDDCNIDIVLSDNEGYRKALFGLNIKPNDYSYKTKCIVNDWRFVFKPETTLIINKTAGVYFDISKLRSQIDTMTEKEYVAYKTFEEISSRMRTDIFGQSNYINHITQYFNDTYKSKGTTPDGDFYSMGTIDKYTNYFPYFIPYGKKAESIVSLWGISNDSSKIIERKRNEPLPFDTVQVNYGDNEMKLLYSYTKSASYGTEIEYDIKFTERTDNDDKLFEVEGYTELFSDGEQLFEVNDTYSLNTAEEHIDRPANKDKLLTYFDWLITFDNQSKVAKNSEQSSQGTAVTFNQSDISETRGVAE